MMTTPEDRYPAASGREGVAALLAISLAATAGLSPRTGIGVLTGGIVGIAHFLWLRGTLRSILSALPAHSGRYAAFHFMARMAVLGFVLYLLLVSGFFSPLALLAGLAASFLTMVALSFRGALRTGG